MTVEKLLKDCGFSTRYNGYYLLRECILIASQDETRLLHIMAVYAEVADRYSVTAWSVEKNIRTSLDRFWKSGGQHQLEIISGGRIYRKPTSGELIEIFVCYLNDH